MYAQLYWLTTEEGGRKTPIKPPLLARRSIWLNTQEKNGNAWSIGVYFDTDDDIPPGTTGKYEIRFLVPEGARQFNSGDTLYICEGKKVVARGAVL